MIIKETNQIKQEILILYEEETRKKDKNDWRSAQAWR
jgi:hypothetical protein